MWGYFTNFKTIALLGTIVKNKNFETIYAKIENGKEFQKREFWLQIFNEKYPQTITSRQIGSVSSADFKTVVELSVVVLATIELPFLKRR